MITFTSGDILKSGAEALVNTVNCVGVMIELEAERFRRKWRIPVWPYVPFVYIGRSPAGLETRVYYFEGAVLHSPN